MVGSTPAIAESTPSLPSWHPPVTHPYLVDREFDKPAKKWQAGHRGVDFRVDAEAKVYSPATGEITFSGTVVDRQVITVTHSDGRKSSFEPVAEPLPVGERVEAGQVIAVMDASIEHCAGGGHCLHWGVREKETEEYLNPLLLLGEGAPSVLLPITDDFAA
ncbi:MULTISPECIES: M23 family metallopeptidase [unclassified Rothia (in: high G+C Gram-positive bacteria)]|uniref:M23 family metallopeptidase n=1 Tax=unclassified Rothia (in: high G+C Gram-positive bacteria) TaxID=2689056 RepID=UPI00195749A7|nr:MULTISPECIES: M23 family metallopeptidase [unclassified Rothia (in: high G+C Gram-positive bacteria)]MBM7051336.1 M23 family metallopeptidase [Rothia sp. ZJ1223]QRZ61125.1 M23 family metallopeptidase [Rothia sp. ZJ932]